MRNIINRTETVNINICNSIICNCCGKEFKEVGFDPCWQNLIHSFEINFGYHSKHDMDTWQFDLCEECLEKNVKKFKIPVKIQEGVCCW